MYIRNFGEFFNDQVKEASTIVVSRVDKINEEKLHEGAITEEELLNILKIANTKLLLLQGKFRADLPLVKK